MASAQVTTSNSLLDPDQILQAVDATRFPSGDITFSATIQEGSGGTDSTTTKYKVSSRNGNDSLIETVFPVKKSGRKYLFENDNLWFYSSDIQKPTRLNLQQRLSGEVANGDLARTKFFIDYEAKIFKTAMIDKKKYYLLNLKAKSKMATYSQADLWVEVKTLAPYKVIYYANTGKPLKEGVFMNYKRDGSIQRPMAFLITSLINKKNVSTILFSDINRVQFEKNYFNKDRLLRF